MDAVARTQLDNFARDVGAGRVEAPLFVDEGVPDIDKGESCLLDTFAVKSC